MNESTDATETTRRRYDRIAPVFDLLEGLMETVSFRRWRTLAWQRVEGTDVLEIGVGTGKNFPFYPANSRVTAIDFSAAMLERAKAKARRSRLRVSLVTMDIEKLAFPADSFDAVVGSFVFCSVPDPNRGLAEILRVLKPGGQLVLLEHVLSDRPMAAWLMRKLNPLVVRLLGANIDRPTAETVAAGGFRVEGIKDLSGIVKLIVARRPGWAAARRQTHASRAGGPSG